MSDSQLLEHLIAAAAEAGRAIHAIYQRGFDVRLKEDRSPITDADQAAEEIILARLGACASGVAIVAEERAASEGLPREAAGEFFLVDPLDGTKEFIERRGDFTVNIALVRAGAPVLGVVYAPANARLFAGDVRAGLAWRSAQDPQHVEAAPRERIRVREAPAGGLTVVASRSHRTPETDAYLAAYRVAELVSVGSSLKFCLLAEGAADLYPRLGTTMEWDTAAGHAVLSAAGGAVLAPDGAPLRYGKPQFRNSWFVARGAALPVQPIPAPR